MTGVRVAAGDDPDLIWGDARAGRFAAALAALSHDQRLVNGRFDLAALQLPDRAFLAVAPDPAAPQPWLLSPRTTFGPAAREEIRREVNGPSAGAFAAAAHATEALLRATGADRAVFVNHPLTSTSLWGGWDGAGLGEALDALRAAWPDRALVFRSLNDWSDAELTAGLREAGARLIPTRVVWTVDDPAAEARRRRDARRDRDLAAVHGYTVEAPEALTGDDLAAVRALYRALYLARHSRFNPDYAEPLMAAMAESGLLRFRLLRGPDGAIDAFCAVQTSADVMTVPLLGYDTGRPQALGLYRMAMSLAADAAAESGARLNLSAGAGGFKRNRGARPQLERMAVFDAHLPALRRIGYAALSRALDALTPALMRIACA